MDTVDREGVSRNYSVTSVSDYISLLKPRVMSLSIFTALAGIYCGTSAVVLHPVILLAIVFCIAVGAGAAGALNMWYEADIDALMKRTRLRPLPSARMQSGEALGLGLFLGVFSCFILGLFTNILAGFLLFLTIFFYSVIYTIWLKRSTAQNIVIGGIAGALPPLIGYVAVYNHIAIEPLVMVGIIFFWTPPHFWSLSLICKSDYRRAGIPMYNIVYGNEAAKWQICCYSLLLFISTLLPYYLGFAGLWYLATSVMFGFTFIFLCFRLYFCSEIVLERLFSKRVFWFSIFHLFVLFFLILVGL